MNRENWVDPQYALPNGGYKVEGRALNKLIEVFISGFKKPWGAAIVYPEKDTLLIEKIYLFDQKTPWKHPGYDCVVKPSAAFHWNGEMFYPVDISTLAPPGRTWKYLHSMHSALALEMLLHYHYNNRPFTSSATPEMTDEMHLYFLREGLLRQESTGGVMQYVAGPALDTYIKAIQAVPFPVKVERWEIPNV